MADINDKGKEPLILPLRPKTPDGKVPLADRHYLSETTRGTKSLELLVGAILDMPRDKIQKEQMMALINFEVERAKREVKDQIIDYVRDMHNVTNRRGPRY